MIFSALWVVILCVFATLPVQAVLYLQEGFNYSPGILGTNSPWTAPTSLIYVTNGGMTFSNLIDFSPPAAPAVVSAGTTSVSYRPLDSTANSGAVYFSFLINFISTPGSFYIGGLLQSTNAPPGGATADPLDLVDNTTTGGFKLGIRAKGGTTTYIGSSLLPLTTGNTYFLVLKYNFTNGTASMYFNPAPGGTEPASPDATSTATSSVSDLSYIYLRSGSTSAGNFKVSALRAGSTWGEVTPAATVQPNILAFTAQPAMALPGANLSAVNVQLENSGGTYLASNGVPVSLALNGGVFSSGTTTVNTDLNGQASFTNLVISTQGSYTITASAAGFTAATGSTIVVSSNGISSQGYQMLAFLNSLRVDQYWLVGTSVNFLTGAVPGSSSNGTNMTIGTDSHCSAFAASVANLLGIYMLRPPQASDLNLANNQADWFLTNTSGWYAISSQLDAQHQANAGVLAIASYKASSGSGHIAILRPTTRSDSDVSTYGPEECQSGTYNFYDTNIMTGFNQHPGAFPSGIKYYGHAVNYPLTPVQPVINPVVISNQVLRASATTLAGRKYQVQWSTNLTSWNVLMTFTNHNSAPGFYTNAPFSDSALSATGKFYRILAQ